MPIVSAYPISPAELLKDYLETEADSALIPKVVVGPASEEHIKVGVVELADAGMPKIEPPGIVWIRSQIRCIGPSIDVVDQMGRHIWEVASNKNRVTARMFNPNGSVRDTYLIHVLKIVAGPSHHWDSAITWETLLFAEMMVGTTPVPTS